MSGALDARMSPRGRVLVLTLRGEHDIESAPDLRRALLAGDNTALTVLDMQACTFVDSTVLGVIASAAKRAAARDAEVVLINAGGIVAKALHLTGMNHVLRWTQPPEEVPDDVRALISADGEDAVPVG